MALFINNYYTLGGNAMFKAECTNIFSYVPGCRNCAYGVPGDTFAACNEYYCKNEECHEHANKPQFIEELNCDHFCPVDVAANPSDALAEALKNRARLQTYSVVFHIEFLVSATAPGEAVKFAQYYFNASSAHYNPEAKASLHSVCLVKAKGVIGSPDISIF